MNQVRLIQIVLVISGIFMIIGAVMIFTWGSTVTKTVRDFYIQYPELKDYEQEFLSLSRPKFNKERRELNDSEAVREVLSLYDRENQEFKDKLLVLEEKYPNHKNLDEKLAQVISSTRGTRVLNLNLGFLLLLCSTFVFSCCLFFLLDYKNRLPNK